LANTTVTNKAYVVRANDILATITYCTGGQKVLTVTDYAA